MPSYHSESDYLADGKLVLAWNAKKTDIVIDD